MDSNNMIFPQNSATTYFGKCIGKSYERPLDCINQINSNSFNNLNGNQPRFYPHYDATSIRRQTRLYKKGVTRGQNRKIPRAKKQQELTDYLARDKKSRKYGKGKNWKSFY